MAVSIRMHDKFPRKELDLSGNCSNANSSENVCKTTIIDFSWKLLKLKISTYLYIKIFRLCMRFKCGYTELTTTWKNVFTSLFDILSLEIHPESNKWHFVIFLFAKYLTQTKDKSIFVLFYINARKWDGLIHRRQNKSEMETVEPLNENKNK